MNAFIIEAANTPGGIAKVTEAIAAKGINITSGACLASGDRGILGLLTNDEQGTREALDAAGIGYKEIELISVTIPDTPGALADASRKLADKGVNIELLVPTGMSAGGMGLALGVDKTDAAREALGEAAAART
jgi:hypothetical protein